MKLDTQVLAQVKGPIHAVWSEVGSDVDSVSAELGESTTNDVAMESAIDAGRMTIIGHPEADALLQSLFAEHGYTRVFKFLCKNIRLA